MIEVAQMFATNVSALTSIFLGLRVENIFNPYTSVSDNIFCLVLKDIMDAYSTFSVSNINTTLYHYASEQSSETIS